MARRNRRRHDHGGWHVRGSNETVRQFSADRRDEFLAQCQLEAMKVQAWLDATLGSAYATRRMELAAELQRLQLQSAAFREALQASMVIEQSRSSQTQFLTAALPYLSPQDQSVVVQLIQTLSQRPALNDGF
ncbi:MAG: hypothetical protein IPP14_05840 [Planctomycetes bacterium]|nr:hypothetical protein [Planctomycetota bacterium]